MCGHFGQESNASGKNSLFLIALLTKIISKYTKVIFFLILDLNLILVNFALYMPLVINSKFWKFETIIKINGFFP